MGASSHLQPHILYTDRVPWPSCASSFFDLVMFGHRALLVFGTLLTTGLVGRVADAQSGEALT